MNGVTSSLPFDERWFSTALKSIGDAVIATDSRGRVLFMNPVAEWLTGWTIEEARGRPIDEVFVIVNKHTRAAAANPVRQAIREATICSLDEYSILIDKQGREWAIDDSAAPIRQRDGSTTGSCLLPS